MLGEEEAGTSAGSGEEKNMTVQSYHKKVVNLNHSLTFWDEIASESAHLWMIDK